MFIFGAVAALAVLFWEAVRLVLWFGFLLLVALVRLVLWTYDRWRDRNDPADHPEWWAAKFAAHPEGGWLA